MSLITKTKSGLKIEKWGTKFIVSKGNQTEVFSSYAAMVRGLTPTPAAAPKPKKAKASKPRKARKARKARTIVVVQAAPKPRKPRKAKKARKASKAKKTVRRVKRNAAGQALNKHGHKRGCKCLACSPATRKAAAAGRAKAAKKGKKGGGKKGGAPARHRAYYPSADPSDFRPRGRPAKAPRVRPEVYVGDTSRFNGRGRGPGPANPFVRRHPARMPFGYLPSGRN